MSSTRSRGNVAAAVSRALRKQGITVLPSGSTRMREGVRVSSFTGVAASVSVDLDAPGQARRLTDHVIEALHAAGYRTTRHHDTTLSVEKGDPADSTDSRHIYPTRQEDGAITMPPISGVEVRTVPGADRMTVGALDLSCEDAVKLAEQILYLATGQVR
jgi:hypothetical protein